MSKRVGYLIISILILLVACKTEKISRKPLEGKNKDFLLEKLEKNEVDFKTFSGRSAITVQNEEKKN